jgi:TetR/AcrR family transcriptional regulator
VQDDQNLPAKSKRKLGRPSGTDGDLRARLLDAAVSRFAQQGIAATALRDIATDAGVTSAMLHYYFGNKTQLEQAVVEERLLPLIGRLGQVLAELGDDVGALIETYVYHVLAAALENAWLPALWLREILPEGGALRYLLLERIGPALTGVMVGRFRHAQTEGRLNPRLDPRLLMISLVGQTMFVAASAPLWRRVLQADDVDTNALCRHTLELLRSGLELTDGR